VLFPHGVLFRQEESELRRKLIEADLVDCVVGLGPNLFYNSAMEACIVFCRVNKPAERRGTVLLIDASGEVARERSVSFLRPEHQSRIVDAYDAFTDVDGFAKVVSRDALVEQGYNLSIPLYLKRIVGNGDRTTVDANVSFRGSWDDWETAGRSFWTKMDGIVDLFDGLARPDSERANG
jgi:type I restriction enzyme M protein